MTLKMEDQVLDNSAGNAIQLLQSMLIDIEDALPTAVRETSIAHRVMPFEPMPEKEQWMFSQKGGDAYVMRESDPNICSLLLNMDGEPVGEFLRGDRHILPITHKTSMFGPKHIQDSNYATEVAKGLAKGLVLKIDQHLRSLLDASIMLTGQVIYYSDDLTRGLITDAHNILAEQELKVENVVLQIAELEKIPGYEVSPLAAAKDFVCGSKFVATALTNVIRPGEMFFLADAKYVGKNLLSDFVVNVSIDPEAAVFTAHADHAMNIANIHSVAKLERE